MRSQPSSVWSVWLVVFVLLLATPLFGCNPFAKAELSDMVPGGHIGSGELECWLTLEFKNIPSGIDPTDIVVRFVSEALERPAEFDWEFIAERDIIAAQKFGGGHQPNPATTPNSAPPLASPVRVKFPLYAKRRIEKQVGSQIWLRAELYWGGVKRDSTQRGIGHMYDYES